VALLPLVVGMVAGRWLPWRVVGVLARFANGFFFLGLAVAIVLALRLGGPVLLSVGPRTWIAGLVLVLGEVMLGYAAGSPQPDDRRPAAIAAARGNVGLVLAIVAASYPGFHSAAFIAAYVLFRTLVFIPINAWMKRWESAGHAPPARA